MVTEMLKRKEKKASLFLLLLLQVLESMARALYPQGSYHLSSHHHAGPA